MTEIIQRVTMDDETRKMKNDDYAKTCIELISEIE